MHIDATDHDTIGIDKFSGAGLCVICDQPVEAHDLGICTVRAHGQDYCYIAHASCIRNAWEEEYDDEEEDDDADGDE